MTPQKPDSTTPAPAPKAALSVANGLAQSPRSDALEAELAMLESILPAKADRSAQPNRVDPATDRGDTP